MSSKKFVRPLSFDLHASRRLTGFLLVTHLLATIAVLMLPWSMAPRAALVCALLLSLGWSVGRHGLRRLPGAICRVQVSASDAWTLWRRDGRVVTGELAGSTFAHPALVILNFRRAAGTQSVIMLPDSLDSDAFRRLRVHLATRSAAVGQAGQRVSIR